MRRWHSSCTAATAASAPGTEEFDRHLMTVKLTFPDHFFPLANVPVTVTRHEPARTPLSRLETTAHVEVVEEVTTGDETLTPGVDASASARTDAADFVAPTLRVGSLIGAAVVVGATVVVVVVGAAAALIEMSAIVTGSPALKKSAWHSSEVGHATSIGVGPVSVVVAIEDVVIGNHSPPYRRRRTIFPSDSPRRMHVPSFEHVKVRAKVAANPEGSGVPGRACSERIAGGSRDDEVCARFLVHR